MEGKRLSEEQLKKYFVSQYQDSIAADGRITCSYIIEHEKYDKYQTKDICHARAYPDPEMVRAYGKPIAIHSSIWGYNETSKRFIEWLFDPAKSPWRKILTDYKLYRKDDGTLVGFSLFDMDKPWRTIMNFLFASRFQFEHEAMLAIFNKALEAGLDEAASFALAHGLSPSKQDKYLFHRYNNSHVAIYPVNYVDSSYFATDIKRLREGNPDDKSEPYWKGKKSLGGNDVNSIWFRGKPGVDLFNLPNANGIPVYNGRFNRLFNVMKDDIGIKLQLPGRENQTVTLQELVNRQQEWI